MWTGRVSAALWTLSILVLLPWSPPESTEKKTSFATWQHTPRQCLPSSWCTTSSYISLPQSNFLIGLNCRGAAALVPEAEQGKAREQGCGLVQEVPPSKISQSQHKPSGALRQPLGISSPEPGNFVQTWSLSLLESDSRGEWNSTFLGNAGM